MKRMKHRLTSAQKKHLLTEIATYLDRAHKDITTAYVFGSFIAAESFSDIDIGILTRDEISNSLNFELLLESEIGKIAQYQTDVRLLNRAPLSFCQNVIRHGRVILERDPNLRAEFEGRILKQYFDFSHFRRQYLHEVTNAPV
jgi:predicted nucleotidyltransferase